MNTKLILGMIAMLLSLNACAGAPTSHFSVQVHEENGAPIEGVMVQGGFSTLMRDYVPGPDVKGITDNEGKTEISGPAYFSVYVDAIKDGYYKSGVKIPVNQKQDQSVSILLRQKKNPTAMYAKNLKLVIPERGREFGFDFLKGDFVMPGHSGNHADVKIMFNRDLINNDDFTQTVSLSFVNPTDGVAEMETNETWSVSDFKTPYNAVESGYESDFKLTYTRKKTVVSKSNINVPLFVRLRSSADKEGNIEAAYYCKIFSGIELYGVLADKPSLKMTYYCNPTINDRNVEFDPRQNLLKNLKHLEKVGAP